MRELSDKECDVIIDEARDGCNDGFVRLSYVYVRAGYAAGYRAAKAEQTSGKGVIGSPPGHTEGQKMPGPLDHQNGVQRDAASPGCALGASSLESGNAREATCLSGEHDARHCPPTQQGQLGTNAGSIPATPTDPIADLCARLRERKHFRPELSALCSEAADALERLACENGPLHDTLAAERQRAERAEADRATLLALVRAADALPDPGSDNGRIRAYKRARAAWKGEV